MKGSSPPDLLLILFLTGLLLACGCTGVPGSGGERWTIPMPSIDGGS